MVLSTIDGTIVATALPTIARDVGGFEHVAWVVTAYALAQVSVMPLYGKLGDLYGRKRVLLIALGIFLTGSALCGVSQTMGQLLAFRALQGVGAGGLGTLAMATLADIVPPRQLGRWLGYQGVVFAVASVAGAPVGGLFVDHLSWRWAFYVNLPTGLVAVAIVAATLRLPVHRVRHAVDWQGAALLTIGLACLVVAAGSGDGEGGWVSPGVLGLLSVVVVLGVLFVWRERRAVEPILPLPLFADPVVRVAAGLNLSSGLLLWCGIVFVPLFAQEVAGLSPSSSGLVLSPLMFGAAFGTMVSGRRVGRTGRYRVWPIAGSVLMAIGVAMLALLQEGTPALALAPLSLLLGTGVGFVMQPTLLAVQNSVDHRDLGVATSTTLLCRVLGGTVGTPLFGSILNAGLPDAGLTRGASAFADAIPPVFMTAVPVGVLAVVLALRLPERPLREHAHVTGVPEPVAVTQ